MDLLMVGNRSSSSSSTSGGWITVHLLVVGSRSSSSSTSGGRIMVHLLLVVRRGGLRVSVLKLRVGGASRNLTGHVLYRVWKTTAGSVHTVTHRVIFASDGAMHLRMDLMQRDLMRHLLERGGRLVRHIEFDLNGHAGNVVVAKYSSYVVRSYRASHESAGIIVLDSSKVNNFSKRREILHEKILFEPPQI